MPPKKKQKKKLLSVCSMLSTNLSINLPRKQLAKFQFKRWYSVLCFINTFRWILNVILLLNLKLHSRGPEWFSSISRSQIIFTLWSTLFKPNAKINTLPTSCFVFICYPTTIACWIRCLCLGVCNLDLEM